LTSIKPTGADHGTLFVVMIASERIRLAVALVAAMLFAAAPAVRGYCGMALPAAASATSQAAVVAWPPMDEDGAGHDDPCCCDVPPAAAVDERASPKESAPFGGKLPLLAFILPPGVIAGHAAPVPRLTGYRAPPPEPALRRFPRRLL
jgi:hypothetical protein